MWPCRTVRSDACTVGVSSAQAANLQGMRKRVGPAGRGYHDASGRPSATKGTINRTAGGIGQDNVSFHMRSGYDRGLDWTVEVFTVSADKFNLRRPGRPVDGR